MRMLGGFEVVEVKRLSDLKDGQISQKGPIEGLEGVRVCQNATGRRVWCNFYASPYCDTQKEMIELAPYIRSGTQKPTTEAEEPKLEVLEEPED